MLTPIGALAWVVLIGVLLLFGWFKLSLARARTGLRTIEASHRTNQGNDHEDLQIDQLPARLRAVSHEFGDELRRAGFTQIVSGCRRKLKEGGCDSYYVVFSSPDQRSELLLLLVRTGRVLSLWPAPLPFPEITGIAVFTIAIESLLDDNTTLITTDLSEMASNPLPIMRVQIAPAGSTPLELWKLHERELEELLSAGRSIALLFKSSAEHFQKETLQREQIDKANAEFMRKLREESQADLWDLKEE